MESNPKKRKFFIQIILWPAEYTQIYNLAHYEKTLDIPDLDDIFVFPKACKKV